MSIARKVLQYCFILEYTHTNKNCTNTKIKTHGSELRGQEEADLRDEPVSYLQVALL